MICVDANVVLRYLLDDNAVLYARAKAIIESVAEIYLPYEVLAEIVYVLSTVYAVERRKIADTLSSLIRKRNIRFDRTDTALTALGIYRDSSIDIVDALLCARALRENIKIESFDTKVNAYITRHLPSP